MFCCLQHNASIPSTFHGHNTPHKKTRNNPPPLSHDAAAAAVRDAMAVAGANADAREALNANKKEEAAADILIFAVSCVQNELMS